MVIIATTAVALYVSGRILDHIIHDAVWHKKLGYWFFPPKTYLTELTNIIIETIDEFKESNPIQSVSGKFPFYQSKEFLEKLSLFVLFEEGTSETSTKLLELHTNVIVPKEKQLNTFFDLFLAKARSSAKLKAHFINENYKTQIFKISTVLIDLSTKLERVEGNTEEILEQLQKGPSVHIVPKELTLRRPKLRKDQIIGRLTDLKDLHSRLFDIKQVVLVNGMGGIGKTTLAEVYVTEYINEYNHIAWVSQTSEDLENDFINSPGLLESLHIDKKDKTLGQLFQESLMALKGLEDGPNLLVIDNATVVLSTYLKDLPGQPHWHVLATSRVNIDGFDPKELDFLNETESIALFKKHYNKKKIDVESIKEIVRSIDYHTLTIEILAKTAQEQRKSPKSILTAIENDLPADVKVRHSMDKIEKITSYLCSIFDLSELAEDEKWLLSNLACLPPEFHTYELLKELIQPDEKRVVLFSKLLLNLTTKGWVLFVHTQDSYKLHRILIDVIGTSLPMEYNKVEPLISNITDNIKVDHSKDNPVDKFKWVPYGNAILKQFGLETIAPIAVLQNNLALRLQDQGEYQQAKKLLEKAVKSDEKNFGLEHPTTAIRYSNLALVLQDLGDFEKAKKLFEKTVKSSEKNFGLEHPSTARNYSNLATVLQDLGDFQNAKKLLEKALKSDEKNFGLEHPSTVIRYSNLALVLQDLGEFQKAKELLEKAVKSNEKNFGLEHPSTAKSYSNLAKALRGLGDYQNAKKLLEKALKSDEKNFGLEHPSTARSSFNLAMVLQDLGDFQNAKKLTGKALDIFEELLGSDHPNTIVVRKNLDYINEKVNKS